MSDLENTIAFQTSGRIAIITLNNPKKLNALTRDHYYHIAKLLRHIATKPDIYITIFTGNGRFFSAGADVGASSPQAPGDDLRRHFLKHFVSNNLEVTHAFYTHPKILITALNGPVVGFSAAVIAFSDFIYAVPQTFLLTPFSSLGLVAEGGASRAFVERMGISKTNEALIMSKRISCEELVACGFVNKVFDLPQNTEGAFLDAVLMEINERLGENLNNESMIKIKALIRRPGLQVYDQQLVGEVLEGLDRLSDGIPQREEMKIMKRQKRHKL